MCKQNIIQHTCSHRGYGLIIPCISRAIHTTGFKRFVYKASSACPLPGCDGPKSTGTYSPEGHEDVLVNGNNITGFVLFTSNSELLASWEKGAYPLAEKDYTPPISLSAIPEHLLETIADAIQAHCRNKGDGRGFQRTRQHRYWSHGLRWRVGDHAEGDIWGAGEEMPKGLPCAWSDEEGFEMGKTGPVVPRYLEEAVGKMVKEMGGGDEF